MTNEQDNDKQDPSPADRLEQIKQEAKEDASSYYDQGKSENDAMTPDDFEKPVPPVDEEKEEMSMMKALAYLGFGMGALAIIVILFFLIMGTFGIMTGEVNRVLEQAVQICLSCIGIG